MMTRSALRLPLVVLLVAGAGCSGEQLGQLGEILTGTGGQPGQAQSGTVTVEIQEVRQQQQQIVVATQEGQQGAVLYDQNTQVLYQEEQYPVRALEYGDIVDMRIQEIQQGYYTDLIQVRQTVQERQGGYRESPEPDVYRVEGTIGEIDLQEWMFTLQMTQGGELPIYLTADASAAERDRLRQYQPEDYVRVEVRPIDDRSAELIRWGWDR
jgi:hypothetical protein